MPAHGHSPDGIAVLVEEDRVLFAGDSFMPLPYVVDGNAEDITTSIKKIGRMGLENIIQGHGDIILRGEIEAAVKENLIYLTNIRKVAKTATRRRLPQDFLDENKIESCGKSRIYLGGLAEELHSRNLRSLYLEEKQAKDSAKEEEKNKK
jgi:glyoxylase-like metal-dependent hydrolase (beta-lactamase superfamily II)